jgi:hypothetical protein
MAIRDLACGSVDESSYQAVDRHQVVYRWDLDKTYLRTEFDTLRDLLSRAFEKAKDKHTVPGASALLREIRATRPAGLYILSGSPEQMRRVLEAKLRLDGVTWDGFTLKPSLKQLLRGHFKFLKDQVGFKLGALLSSREVVPEDTDEILFGDDAETDAFVYSLYADLCAGRVGAEVLTQVLERAAVRTEEIPELLRLAGRLPRRDHCLRIFIHLDRISSLDPFSEYGLRVCPFYNYFQPALVLVEMGAIEAKAALRVAAELVIDQAFSPEALLASFTEVARRGHIGRRAKQAVLAALAGVGVTEFATATSVLVAFGHELEPVEVGDAQPADAPEAIDYPSLLARERARARAAKLRVTKRTW